MASGDRRSPSTSGSGDGPGDGLPLRAALAFALKEQTRNHLKQRGLTPEWLAAKTHMSPDTANKIFSTHHVWARGPHAKIIEQWKLTPSLPEDIVKGLEALLEMTDPKPHAD